MKLLFWVFLICGSLSSWAEGESLAEFKFSVVNGRKTFGTLWLENQKRGVVNASLAWHNSTNDLMAGAKLSAAESVVILQPLLIGDCRITGFRGALRAGFADQNPISFQVEGNDCYWFLADLEVIPMAFTFSKVPTQEGDAIIKELRLKLIEAPRP